MNRPFSELESPPRKAPPVVKKRWKLEDFALYFLFMPIATSVCLAILALVLRFAFWTVGIEWPLGKLK